MNHADNSRCWEENAEAWTILSRQGFDVYRDLMNSPAFMNTLPNVNGLRGLDIGCGEGYNTRLVGRRGARMIAFDIAPTFVYYAHQEEKNTPVGIEYLNANAVELPFIDNSFEFVVAFMSMMDMPEQEKAVNEVYRVLKPGGFFQFSMTHPCFDTSKRQWIHDDSGRCVALACGDYFDQRQGNMEEWTFGAAPPEISSKFKPFQVPRFPRILSDRMNLLIDSGFILEKFIEPCVDEITAEQIPYVADSRIVAQFLIVRCRKNKG